VSRAGRSATAQRPARTEGLRASGRWRVPGLAGPARVAEVAGVAGVSAPSQAVKMRPRALELQAPRAQPLHPR